MEILGKRLGQNIPYQSTFMDDLKEDVGSILRYVLWFVMFYLGLLCITLFFNFAKAFSDLLL